MAEDETTPEEELPEPEEPVSSETKPLEFLNPSDVAPSTSFGSPPPEGTKLPLATNDLIQERIEAPLNVPKELAAMEGQRDAMRGGLEIPPEAIPSAPPSPSAQLEAAQRNQPFQAGPLQQGQVQFEQPQAQPLAAPVAPQGRKDEEIVRLLSTISDNLDRLVTLAEGVAGSLAKIQEKIDKVGTFGQ